MKKIILTILTFCILLSVSGCSSRKNCDCMKENIYRQPISSRFEWEEEKNIYDLLPENAEVIEIIDITTDSHYPKYDIIYTIHNCGK